MEEQLPVKVIAPEKELTAPEFQKTPLEVSETPQLSPEFTSPPVKELVESPTISVEAQNAIDAVTEPFNKFVDDIRANYTTNTNIPAQPFPVGQQIYEPIQQFSEDFEEYVESFPFKLSVAGNFTAVKFGMVYGNYSDGATAYPPYFMYNQPIPHYISGNNGFIYIYLTVNSFYKIIPTSVDIRVSSNPPVFQHPEYAFVIGYRDGFNVSNAFKSSVNFYVCGFRGVFSTFLA